MKVIRLLAGTLVVTGFVSGCGDPLLGSRLAGVQNARNKVAAQTGQQVDPQEVEIQRCVGDRQGSSVNHAKMSVSLGFWGRESYEESLEECRKELAKQRKE